MSVLKNKKFSLVILNAAVLLFVIIYAFVRSANAVATAFACIMLATVVINLLYFSLAKYKFGYFIIALTMGFFLINIISHFVIALSIFSNSTSIVGIIALALINVVAIVGILLDILDKRGKIVAADISQKSKLNAFIIRLVALTAIVGLLILIILGIITFAGVSAINTNIVNLASLFIFLGCALFAVFARVFACNKGIVPHKKWVVGVAIALVAVSTAQFAAIQGVAYSDSKRNSKEFVAAFGNIKNEEITLPRNSAYSYADEFFGVVTKDYSVKKDIEYYIGAEGSEKGVRLKYDVYFPTFEGAKKAVLLNLHGSGGDKDTGNYAHRNKYFASRGYVVYDIQFGDFNEKDINFNWEIRNSKAMLLHINRFFRYALAHNDVVKADFNNTFLTGVSMGGGIVSKFAYTQSEEMARLGIKIRGIIPVYPGYSNKETGIDNYLNYVTNESAPCLLVMSLSDVVVYRDVVDYTRAAYAKAGNSKFACVGITFAGHGSDGLLTGRFNQAYMYYAERFMSVLTK